MNVTDLLGSFYPNENLPDFDIKDISVDTRNVQLASLFIMIEGENFDPHEHVKEIEKNVVFFITEKPIDTNRAYLVDPDIKEKLGKIYARFYQHPEKTMDHIGITGTNGKTSIGSIVQHIFNQETVSYIGTLGVQINGENIELDASTPTTPQAPELYKMLEFFREKAVTKNIMEVSSHALKQKRASGIPFKYAIFSNLSVDHLDFHRTMEDYFHSKKILFDQLEACAFAITNVDDDYGEKIVADTKGTVIRYGFSEAADFQLSNIKFTEAGTSFSIKDKKEDATYSFGTKLIGKFNVYNLASAIIIGLLEKIPFEVLSESIKQFQGVPGRLEKVPSNKRNVFIDYAHTADGLDNVLSSLHEIRPAESKIITVFGCGGDRDRTKRPEMGKIAEKYSDVTIVTSDNPRTEDPQSIIDDVCKGMQNPSFTFVSREEAIKHAISISHEKDLILIAGKGHEDYQIIGTKTIDFDDKKVSLTYL